MSALFEPLRLRDVEARNRIAVSPMCQYSATDEGHPTDWHLVHLGSRAAGGAGMVILEATAVVPEGRISPWDLGLWDDAHAESLAPIARFIASQGAVPAVQLAHAGRKACTNRPWLGGRPIPVADGGWQPVAPSAIAFTEGYPEPRALSADEVAAIPAAFAAAARRAVSAGFRAVEIHAAHGYLLHQFLSPHTNRRTDAHGGDEAGRTRLAVDTAAAVREAVGDGIPVLVRISASEYVDGGWDLSHSVALAARLRDAGVDLVDVSSGGNLPQQRLDAYPGYQVAFAREIRARAGVATGAVGLVTEPAHAEAIVRGGDADLVLLGRVLLRDPCWPLHAARALGAEAAWPNQYLRARP